MNEYSWDEVSPDADFLWGDEAEAIGHRPVDSNDADDLPLARMARAHGFEVAPAAPMWMFLPVVWPPAARAWIRDSRVQHMRTYVDGELVKLPCTTADYLDAAESDHDFLAAVLPLPKRPAGRVWLLRPPPGHASIEETVSQLSDTSWAAGAHPDQSPGDFLPFLQHCEWTLRGLFQDE